MGRDQNRKTWGFGPYTKFEHATELLDYVEDLILEMGAEPNNYVVTVEERYLQEGKWLKLNTKTRITFNDNKVTTESG